MSLSLSAGAHDAKIAGEMCIVSSAGIASDCSDLSEEPEVCLQGLALPCPELPGFSLPATH